MKRAYASWCGWLVLLTLLACSYSDYTGWTLANRRDHPLEIWVRKTPFCVDDADLSDETNYDPPERVIVRAQDYVHMSQLTAPNSSLDPYRSCGATWVRFDDFEAVLAWRYEPEWDDEGDPIPTAVIVEGPRDHTVVHVPPGIAPLPVPK